MATGRVHLTWQRLLLLLLVIFGIGQIGYWAFVAEGIEDQATLEMLESLGCDVAQGFFLSRPIGATELARWCRESGRVGGAEAAAA